MNPNAIEEEIISALDRVADAGKAGEFTSDTDWTARIKQELAALGATHGFSTYASKCPSATGGEWLFDLSWFVMDGKHIRSAPLILESEWDRRGLMDDFPKLVVGRAQHRVMVFQSKNEQEKDEDLKEFFDEIDGSDLTQQGDRYLFACWDIRDKVFRYDLHVVGDAP